MCVHRHTQQWNGAGGIRAKAQKPEPCEGVHLTLSSRSPVYTKQFKMEPGIVPGSWSGGGGALRMCVMVLAI